MPWMGMNLYPSVPSLLIQDEAPGADPVPDGRPGVFLGASHTVKVDAIFREFSSFL